VRLCVCCVCVCGKTTTKKIIPAFGIAEGDLKARVRNGIIPYGPGFDNVVRKCKQLIIIQFIHLCVYVCACEVYVLCVCVHSH